MKNQQVEFIANSLLHLYETPLLNLDIVGKVLNVKKATLRQYISRETFPIPATKIGNEWMVTALSLAEYVVNNQVNFSE